VRLCVACGQLKSASRFQAGRRKCLACQAGRQNRADHAAGSQAQPRFGLEREIGRCVAWRPSTWTPTGNSTGAELLAIPASMARKRAASQATGRALRALEKQLRRRCDQLYQQELRRARSEPLPVRPGRPPGTRIGCRSPQTHRA
jgi:hypothetical protein